MIQLKGQLTALFSIGDGTNEKKDFISVENLESLTIFTHAGNIRPSVELKFILDDPSIISYLNAGNNLKVAFGVEEITKDEINFQLISDDTKVQPKLGYSVKIVGVMYFPKFTSNVRSQLFSGVTSIEVLKSIVKNNTSLKFVTNIDRTNDKQDWFQSGETNWEFMQDVWLHSYINEKTFIMCGFDAYNFYFYDMRKLLSEPPKWKFTPNSTTRGNLINYNDYDTQNEYGVIAPLIGQNLINNVCNIDMGKFSNSSYSLKNFTVQDSNKLNLNTINCQDYEYNFVDNSLHKNYITAYNQNVRNSLMYSTFSTYITTTLPFRAVNLFDTAEIEAMTNDVRIEGTHIISGINYQYSDGVLWTNITFNKEAPSGIKGGQLAQ